jgi:uncharacterized membrane protein
VRRGFRVAGFVSAAVFGGPFAGAAAMPGDGAVHAVLFSSPTCPHCRKVREQCLPALLERFGGRLQIAVLSTATQSGRDLYRSAVQRFSVRQRGVPLLVIGDTTLVGDVEIPEKLPDLVVRYQQQGGVDWPEIPGLAAVLAEDGSSIPRTAGASPSPSESRPPESVPAPAPLTVVQTPVPPTDAQTLAPQLAATSSAPAHTAAISVGPEKPGLEARPDTVGSAPVVDVAGSRRDRPELAPSQAPQVERGSAGSTTAATPAPVGLRVVGEPAGPVGPLARLRTDPVGNGLAVLVLLAIVAALARTAVVLLRPAPPPASRGWDRLSPALALLGIGVAYYLARVEVQAIEAVCGPVGDCNTVQHSAYARLFGIVPIGVLGVVGFATVLLTWIVKQCGSVSVSRGAALLLLAMTTGGALFSAYLTFLEPFVIGATCLWCLGSAVLMTGLHVLALPDGHAAGRLLGSAVPSQPRRSDRSGGARS